VSDVSVLLTGRQASLRSLVQREQGVPQHRWAATRWLWRGLPDLTPCKLSFSWLSSGHAAVRSRNRGSFATDSRCCHSRFRTLVMKGAAVHVPQQRFEAPRMLRRDARGLNGLQCFPPSSFQLIKWSTARVAISTERLPVKLLFELLPVIVFFVAFRLARAYPDAASALVSALPGALAVSAAGDFPDMVPIATATLFAVVATLLQIGWLLLRGQKVKPMLWVSCGLIVVFGGLTLWLHNEWFIKWKPSLLYLSFAAVLLGGKWFGNRNLLGIVLGSELKLPAAAWDRLLYAWAGFFVFLAVANLAVAYSVSTSTWVDFKTFGLLGLTLVFSIATAFLVARSVEEPVTSMTLNVPPKSGSPPADQGSSHG
jgi:intracellular septation protein